MSVFSRFFKVGMAKANQLVSSMEKPELMLEQAIMDKEKQVQEAKKAIQSLIASERQAKALLDKEKSDSGLWEQKAEAALKAGREDLSIKALTRAEEHGRKFTSLEQNWTMQRSNADKLKQDIMKLEDELAEFKRNKDFIIAQSKAAEVKKQIYQAKAKITKDSSADDLMARMKAKAERISFEAEAAEEMADSFSGGDKLEKEFTEISAGPAISSNVQNKLIALKAKIG